MVAPSRRRRAWPLLAGLALLASGCAKDAPQDYLTDLAGPQARLVDRLWDPVFLVATGIFFLVQGLIIYAVVRFRRRSDDEAPVQVHGNAKLELGWTILPALLLAFVGVGTVTTLFKLADEPAGDVVKVNVIGHQFWWEYEYPDLGITTANELVLPVDTQVRLSMTSQEAVTGGDGGVIHSYWIPKLSPKQDVVPGRVNRLTLQADAPGRYLGQCAEYCGQSHANMRAVAVALSKDDFSEWAAEQQRAAAKPSAELAAAGYELFAGRGCTSCHAIEGYPGAEGDVGPNLTHLMSRETFAGSMFELNDANLRRWLRDPPAMKPMNVDGGTGMPDLDLSEEDITALIAYLNTLE